MGKLPTIKFGEFLNRAVLIESLERINGNLSEKSSVLLK